MGLAGNFLAYIRFFIFLAPIIIPSFAILGSLFNQDIKGFLYVFGVVIATGAGRWFSTMIPNYVPNDGKGVDAAGKYIAGKFKAYNDSACNLFASDGVEGWGTVRSSPGPHALFLAFTLTYMAFPMFMNNNINFLVLGGLMFILILSAMLRVMPPMFCIGWSDVVMGWGTGFILGALWLFFIRWINAKYPSNSFTYFGKLKSDRQQCILEKSAFRCKKTKKAT